MKIAKLLLATSLILAVSMFSAWYLFRQVVIFDEDHPLGITLGKYRWGRPHELIRDENRDGQPDSRYLVNGTFDNVPPQEGWLDPYFIGIFTVHFVRTDDGHRVEIDLDNDGSYDQILEGNSAEKYLDALSQEARIRLEKRDGGDPGGT